MATRTTFGPGRVNLVGDHTDYNGGVALPMAVDLGVTVTFEPDDRGRLDVRAEGFGHAHLRLDGSSPDGDGSPPWAALIVAMVALARPSTGGDMSITSSLPVGAGLSSSAALCVALARAFDVEGPPLAVARLCRAAEHRVGAPVGLMDPWVSAGGSAGHALLLDFALEVARPVPLPADVEVVVVDSGEQRTLRTSAYAARVAECEAAAAVIGPLPQAGDADLLGLRDPTLRRRARHVAHECRRVQAVAAAFGADDAAEAGRQMTESHRSLAEDFEVSTPAIDALVAELGRRPGVLGARLTGAGFGGCVVALARPGALDAPSLGLGRRAWRVEASDGAYAAPPGTVPQRQTSGG